MKYQNLGLQDDVLIHSLISKLGGVPKAVTEALPRHVMAGSFLDFADAVRSKFRINDSACQVKAYVELKRRLKRDRDIARLCLEIENLMALAFPLASKEELSQRRATELVFNSLNGRSIYSSIRHWRLLRKALNTRC